MDAATDFAPSVHRTFESHLLECANAAIQSHPRHDLRIGKVPGAPTHFPHALVRLTPDLLQVLEDGALESPVRVCCLQPPAPRMMHRVTHLTEHVELKLTMGRVADAHGH